MAATFPASVKTFTTPVDGEVIYASETAAEQEEIVAIETRLLANTFPIGDGTPGNKVLQANNGDANPPSIRFNDTSNIWEFTSDGTVWNGLGSPGEIPSGATLPASPLANQLFLHTPTGRKVLMLYTGSVWYPVYSFGTFTVYVDGTLGTDAADKGTASGADAWKTLTYAWSQIANTYFGNVVIGVAAGTYSETLTCQGKVAGGAFTITFTGEETVIRSGTVSSAVLGTGATQGSLTEAGAGFTVDEHKGRFVKVGSNYRVIASNTADTLVICGPFSVLPSGSYSIVDLATALGAGASAARINDQTVYFTKIKFTNASSQLVYPRDGARGYFTTCVFEGSVTSFQPSYDAYVGLSYCVIKSTANTTINMIMATLLSTGTLFWRSSGTRTGTGILCGQNCALLLNGGGNVIENFSTGVYASNGGIAYCDPAASAGYNFIINNATGVYALTGGEVTGTANNQYSGNTTANETAVSASYGYID